MTGSLLLAAPALAHEGGRKEKGRHGMASTTLIKMHDDDDDDDDRGGRGRGQRAAFALPFGNGQPIVAGTVTAVSSTTFTITNKGGASFSVNAAGANIVKNNATSTLSNVAVGDAVVIQGTVNGSSITASAILEKSTPNATSTKARGNFFGHINKFFSRLFGFF